VGVEEGLNELAELGVAGAGAVEIGGALRRRQGQRGVKNLVIGESSYPG
jgi:hypothetical protein